MKNIKLIKIAILLTSVSLVYISHAQRGYKSKRANSLDLVVSGDVGYRLISILDSSVKEQLENRITSESFKLNYKAGLNFNFGLNKKLLLKTGIRVSNPGYSITSVERIDFNQDVNDIVKKPLRRDDASKYEYKVQYNLLQVPLGIKYIASRGACEPYFELGIMPSFYGGTKIYELQSDETRSETINVEENINTINYISFISTGGNYRIADNASLFLQMSANYQLNNLRKGDLKENLVSLGVEAGVRLFL